MLTWVVGPADSVRATGYLIHCSSSERLEIVGHQPTEFGLLVPVPHNRCESPQYDKPEDTRESNAVPNSIRLSGCQSEHSHTQQNEAYCNNPEMKAHHHPLEVASRRTDAHERPFYAAAHNTKKGSITVNPVVGRITFFKFIEIF